jgi:hypothetical protein
MSEERSGGREETDDFPTLVDARLEKQRAEKQRASSEELAQVLDSFGAAGRIRTHYPLVRRQPEPYLRQSDEIQRNHENYI